MPGPFRLRPNMTKGPRDEVALPRLNGRKLAKSIPLARLEGLKKHTLAGGTSPGTFTTEEPPPPRAKVTAKIL